MLTKEQIRAIYEFVKTKYVKYYDLQIQLVHQLANKVEFQLEQNPEMNFEEALQKAYSSYGIFGFSQIVSQKENQMNRQNMQLWVREFFHWFTWPQIFGMIVLFLILWEICDFIPVGYVAVAFVVFFMVVGLSQFLKGRRSVLHNRSPLLMLVPFRVSLFQVGYFFCFVPFYLFIITDDFSMSKKGWPWLTEHNWVVALWITVSLLFILSHLAVYKKVLAQAKERYPGFFKRR